MKNNKAIILAIGDELLIGQVTDTNSGWIAGQLEALGIQTIKRIALPDVAAVIENNVDKAIQEAGYVVLTGGLGPTSDDLTKEALAEYFQKKLVRNKAVYTHLVELFERNHHPLTPDNEDQALIPEGFTVLKNEIGSAPGMWLEKEDTVVISLPGVPYEMQAIFSNEVVPKIANQDRNYGRAHRYFLLLDVTETYVARKIADIERDLPDFIKLAYLPNMGTLRLRLSGGHQDVEQLNQQLDNFALRIEERLGNLVASRNDETLESLIGSLLKAHRKTLALAESCTGGLIAHRITNVAGSSAYFKGSIVSYANSAKEDILKVEAKTLKDRGAVSREVVLKMAESARCILKADIALAVSGVMGQDGGSPEKPVGTVWVAICDKNKSDAHVYHFHHDRLQNKMRTSHKAFELLRRWLLQMPIE